MRKSVVLVGAMLVASAAVGGDPAKAADLYGGSLKDEPVYAPPAYSWTGFYFGGHVGYEWKRVKDREGYGDWGDWAAPWIADPLAWGDSSRKADGWIGGIQGGYNHQFGRAVVGTELSWSWGDVGGSGYCLRSDAGLPLGDEFKCSADQDWTAQWLNKVGVAFGPDNRWLGYMIGGVAATRVGVSRTYYNYDGVDGDLINKRTSSGSGTTVGVVLGAGLQWAFANNWSMGVEYLHAEYASMDIGTTVKLCDADDCGTVGRGLIHARPSSDTVRAVINFKFN